MKKYIILICTVLILSLVGPYYAFADSTTYLSDEEGLELDWTFTEPPPKRPQPKILNSTNYEVKWKIDNTLMNDIVLDQKGVVYTSDSKDMVRAIYPNGKEKWSIHLDMGFEISVIYLIIGQDGTVYAHSSDSLSEQGLTTIYALSPEGKIKWKLQSQDIYSVFNSQFAGDAQGNFVFFSKEGLTSRNAKGDVNWINKAITSSAPRDYSRNSHKVHLFMDSKGNLYLDSILSEVISLDHFGVERWRTEPLQYVNKFSSFQPHLSANGLLYLLTVNGLYALNTHDGSSVDKMKLDKNDIQSSGVPMDGQGGYYINYRGRFLNINQYGEINWEYKGRETEKNGIGSVDAPLTDKEGNVYFNTGVGNIIMLNSQGQELFVFLRNAFWSKIDNLVLDNNSNVVSTLDDIGLVSFGKKQIQVYIDNLSLPLTAAPINHDGTVLVPFRSLFENAGLKVSWDPDLKTITGTKEGLSIKLTIGEKTAFVNGQGQELNESPLIENNSTFVPLRFVGETLGRKVTWDGASSSINIDRE